MLTLVLAVGATIGILLGGLPTTTSSTPSPTGDVASYQTLSDGTIRRCPAPDAAGLPDLDACLNRYLSGLDRLSLPATLASTILDAHQLVQQLTTCRSQQLHDDVTMREWPVGCPQPGPATPGVADAEDLAFRHEYYALLLGDDNTLRRNLGLPVRPAATPPG